MFASSRSLLRTCVLAGGFAVSWPALADPLKIYAAGSLRNAIPALIKDSGLPGESFAKPVFGPAGLLRERLEKGEAADLFASADVAQPEILKSEKPDVEVVPFARNRMCVFAKAGARADAGQSRREMAAAGLSDRHVLAGHRSGRRLCDGHVRARRALASGRSGAFEGQGAASFRRRGADHALARGHGPVASVFLSDYSDALIFYCSEAAALGSEVPGVVSVALPKALEVHPVFAFALLTRDPTATRFALFVLSDAGQKILEKAGFLPLDEAPAAQADGRQAIEHHHEKLARLFGQDDASKQKLKA